MFGSWLPGHPATKAEFVSDAIDLAYGRDGDGQTDNRHNPADNVQEGIDARDKHARDENTGPDHQVDMAPTKQ